MPFKKAILLTLPALAIISSGLSAQTRKPASAVKAAKTSPAKTASAKPAADPQPAIFRFVEVMPQFNGNLGEWLGSNIYYPDSARVHGQEGKSVVEFIVSATGDISNAHIVRTSGNSYLDDEALRAVRAMPKWKPGTQKGEPVNVVFTLPVTFKLDD